MPSFDSESLAYLSSCSIQLQGILNESIKFAPFCITYSETSLVDIVPKDSNGNKRKNDLMTKDHIIFFIKGIARCKGYNSKIYSDKLSNFNTKNYTPTPYRFELLEKDTDDKSQTTAENTIVPPEPIVGLFDSDLAIANIKAATKGAVQAANYESQPKLVNGKSSCACCGLTDETNDYAKGNTNEFYDKLASKIYDYVTDNFNNKAVLNGTQTTSGPTVSPVVNYTVLCELDIDGYEALKTEMKNVANDPNSPKTIKNIFTAIDTWLGSNSVSYHESLINTIPGSTKILFPMMLASGDIAQTEMDNTTSWPQDQDGRLELFWGIVSKYLSGALNQNSVIPLSVSGSIFLNTSGIINGLVSSAWWWE